MAEYIKKEDLVAKINNHKEYMEAHLRDNPIVQNDELDVYLRAHEHILELINDLKTYKLD